MVSPQTAIEQTRRWIFDVVIACGFCPFAKREMDRNTVFYRVLDDPGQLRDVVLAEWSRLDDNPEIETSLIILTAGLHSFDNYLDQLEQLEKLLVKKGYEGVYQLASFHPGYRFADTAEDDAANFTNRSPYPMFHLLREESIEKALEHYPGDPDEIPERNITFARKKGLAWIKNLRDNCLK